jgi:hypothetical protein
MQLDDVNLQIGSPIYHLIHGDGTIKSVRETNATAVFGRMEMVISDATITNNGIKMIGVQKPLVFWRNMPHNRDVSAYLPIILILDSL